MKKLRILGLTIFSIGGLLLIGYGLYKLILALFTESDMPLFIKWGITALIIVFIIILISLIIERFKEKGE